MPDREKTAEYSPAAGDEGPSGTASPPRARTPSQDSAPATGSAASSKQREPDPFRKMEALPPSRGSDSRLGSPLTDVQRSTYHAQSSCTTLRLRVRQPPLRTRQGANGGSVYQPRRPTCFAVFPFCYRPSSAPPGGCPLGPPTGTAASCSRRCSCFPEPAVNRGPTRKRAPPVKMTRPFGARRPPPATSCAACG
jgi:hypothetical protein